MITYVITRYFYVRGMIYMLVLFEMFRLTELFEILLLINVMYMSEEERLIPSFFFFNSF